MRLRLGTAFIEHHDDLWPKGEPAATAEWIRAHVDNLLAALERAFHIDQHKRADNLLRIPQRMHWLPPNPRYRRNNPRLPATTIPC